jgi:pimeloyl-ACP methyl ester carboxylesterase
MKKSTKKFLFTAAAAVAGMYAYNKFVASAATSKNLLSTTGGDFYDWKNGKIYYSKVGNGSPVLLVHDTNPSSSSCEWSKVIRRLEKNHTVYAIDLLGCGRSEKPGYNYTNYLYVQMIKEFVKDVIGEKTSVVATNLSSSFILMANQMDAELFDKIILINPISIKKLELVPDTLSKVKRGILNVPIVGTFVYNVLMNPLHIDRSFREKYFNRPQLISSNLEDTYYEAAHLEESRGKYLYASLLGNYMNTSIRHALKKIDKPIYLIGSRDLKNNLHTLDEYRRLNKNFEITMLSNGNLYPQLEIPEKIYAVINGYLSK